MAAPLPPDPLAKPPSALTADPAAAGIATWEQLEGWAAPEPDRINGPASAQATLRLFGQPESAVRVTLYRDHHAWCPYCQKVWLWLEEKGIPYRVRKVTMFCYGQKESWYRQLVPSGVLPALELDGRLITESDRILLALEAVFGPLRLGMEHPEVLPLRRLERLLFQAWCQWLCVPHRGASAEGQAAQAFDRLAAAMAEALLANPGPFLLGEISTADLVFVPYLERMNASLTYYKGYLLRCRHPAIDRWFRALEERSAYLGTQSDFHTHAHDLPPQMGAAMPMAPQASAIWRGGSTTGPGRSALPGRTIRRPARVNRRMGGPWPSPACCVTGTPWWPAMGMAGRTGPFPRPFAVP